MARKAPRTAFKPGVSGNPGGQTKAARAVAHAARERTTDAVHILAAICSDCTAPAAARVAAAVAILDRAWGKPRRRRDVTSAGERIGYVVTAAEDGPNDAQGR
jgi:hypothetical protein